MTAEHFHSCHMHIALWPTNLSNMEAIKVGADCRDVFISFLCFGRFHLESISDRTTPLHTKSQASESAAVFDVVFPGISQTLEETLLRSASWQREGATDTESRLGGTERGLVTENSHILPSCSDQRTDYRNAPAI